MLLCQSDCKHGETLLIQAKVQVHLGVCTCLGHVHADVTVLYPCSVKAAVKRSSCFLFLLILTLNQNELVWGVGVLGYTHRGSEGSGPVKVQVQSPLESPCLAES